MSCGNRHESICPQARVELPPLNWHLTVFGCLKARLPRPMRRRAMSALAPALPLGIGSWPRRRMDWGDYLRDEAA